MFTHSTNNARCSRPYVTSRFDAGQLEAANVFLVFDNENLLKIVTEYRTGKRCNFTWNSVLSIVDKFPVCIMHDSTQSRNTPYPNAKKFAIKQCAKWKYEILGFWLHLNLTHAASATRVQIFLANYGFCFWSSFAFKQKICMSSSTLQKCSQVARTSSGERSELLYSANHCFHSGM